MKTRVALAMALAVAFVFSSVTTQAQSQGNSRQTGASAKSLGTADKMATQAANRRNVPKHQAKDGRWAKGGSWNAAPGR